MPLNGELRPSALYITVNSRPKKGEYHWGLMTMSGSGQTTLVHASNARGSWALDIRDVNPANSMTLIVLVRVGEADHTKVWATAKKVPADGSPSARTGEACDCLVWLKDVLVTLHDEGSMVLPRGVDKLIELASDEAARFAPNAELGGGATVVNNL